MFTRRSRLKRNRRLLETYPITGSVRTYRQIHNLLEIWRRIRPSDYSSLTTETLLATRFECTHRNIIELNESCEKQNSLIAEERESQLERGNQQHQEVELTSLDVFFSDSKMVGVSVEQQLRLLTNHLQILYCSFEQEHLDTGGDYYLRVCDFILKDVINFTVQLIEGGSNATS